ncbi:MAG: phosphoribosylanthranilate isomerase [Acidobacteria bacterium]|nr:MAG: phosphoribosylanthranilate isomerase [Acidobacteriota bacterium]
MTTLVQIYEVTSPKEAAALAALGVNHIGVLVGKGKFPREQSYTAARQIFAAVPARGQKLSLSLANQIEELAEVVEETRPDILHLGTRPDDLIPSQVLELKALFPTLKVMRTIPVRDERDIAIAKSYEGIADFLLLDTWKSGEPEIGACGLVHDWAVSRRIVAEVQIDVILAGGIGPENASEAIRLVSPAGLDSKTKTDLPDGSGKDLQKVRAMVQAVRRAG